jgi:hypothetical protein
MAEVVRRFPIPSSLQDLERAPYNLIPYPADFDDVDEVSRAASFSELVRLIEVGNRTLNSANMTLFVSEDEDEEPWLEQSRIQALYTLVRCVLDPSAGPYALVALSISHLHYC